MTVCTLHVHTYSLAVGCISHERNHALAASVPKQVEWRNCIEAEHYLDSKCVFIWWAINSIDPFLLWNLSSSSDDTMTPLQIIEIDSLWTIFLFLSCVLLSIFLPGTSVNFCRWNQWITYISIGMGHNKPAKTGVVHIPTVRQVGNIMWKARDWPTAIYTISITERSVSQALWRPVRQSAHSAVPIVFCVGGFRENLSTILCIALITTCTTSYTENHTYLFTY